jgi:hypothetical protein
LRVYQTRWFTRFALKEGISQAMLRAAIVRAESGSVDADLGGHVIKQWIARPGQGRSGGYRTIIAFRTAKRSVFLYGFAKNERDNIDAGELDGFRKLARQFLGMTDSDLERAATAGELTEVWDGEEREDKVPEPGQ